MDWLDLLAVQGTLKSLLLHHSSKASVLRHSTFFTVQLSRPYMTTGKTIVLTGRTFVGKAMSLLLNMLSRLVITFLPRSTANITVKAIETWVEIWTLLHCWWECKLVQPLWRTVWRFPKKLEIELRYDPAIPLLGIHTKDTRIERDICTPMFTAALFTIARTWK